MNGTYRITSMLMTFLMAITLAGCGSSTGADQSEKDYPVWELVDISDMELLTAEDDTMKYQVPAENWIPGTNASNEMIVVLADSYGAEMQVAVSTVVGDHGGTVIDSDFAQGVSASISSDLGMSVKSAELRNFNGNSICCMELTVDYTDDVIDNMLEYGVLTEEDLNNVGGREYFLSIPPYDTVSVYMLVGDKRITCGGSYYNQEQKDEVMNLINVIFQTIELK